MGLECMVHSNSVMSVCASIPDSSMSEPRLMGAARQSAVQGYLAHKKTPPP